MPEEQNIQTAGLMPPPETLEWFRTRLASMIDDTKPEETADTASSELLTQIAGIVFAVGDSVAEQRSEYLAADQRRRQKKEAAQLRAQRAVSRLLGGRDKRSV